MTQIHHEEPKAAAERRGVNPAVGFGTSFAVGMALFAFLGHALDEKTGREPLFTLIGVGLGLLYGAWELWKLITLTNQQAENGGRAREESEEHHEPTR